MNKKLAVILGFICLTIGSTNVYANHSEHYVFEYETGDVYDVTFTDSSVMWKGLEGSDKGQSETDFIKTKKISNNVEVIQWNEKNGSFITVIFDRTNLDIVSSIKTNDGSWLMSGKASYLTPAT